MMNCSLSRKSVTSVLTIRSPSNRSALKHHGICPTAPFTFVSSAPVPWNAWWFITRGERMGEARLLDAVANDRKPLNPPSTKF